jgi:hypothetical protein
MHNWPLIFKPALKTSINVSTMIMKLRLNYQVLDD